MKYILFLAIAIFFLNACKKSDGNQAPVIKFKSITASLNNVSPDIPYLSIKVKDADGDFGFSGKDTSFVFIKNVSNPPFIMDSFVFPSNLTGANIKNIEFELETNLKSRSATTGSQSILGPQIRTTKDTMYFEVYVKDIKRNKSNVIRTDNPLVLIY